MPLGATSLLGHPRNPLPWCPPLSRRLQYLWPWRETLLACQLLFLLPGKCWNMFCTLIVFFFVFSKWSKEDDLNTIIPFLPPTAWHSCFSCGGEAEAIKVQWEWCKLGQLYSSWAQMFFPPVFLSCLLLMGVSCGVSTSVLCLMLRVCTSALRHAGSAQYHTPSLRRLLSSVAKQPWNC